SPDTYLAQNMSQMITLTKSSSGWNESNAMTGNLNNRRWFSSSVLLPNGQVVVFNGADKDEVILPGSEMPVHQAELFDPATNKWTALSSSARDRDRTGQRADRPLRAHTPACADAHHRRRRAHGHLERPP